MKDRIWQAAYQATLPVLIATDVVLVPRGDWSEFPCRVIYYDALIDIQDATVIILHKARLTGIMKSALVSIVADWQWIYANAVFVVFARPRKKYFDVRYGWRRIYLGPVFRYARSRELKRRQSTIYYIHLPKTGGTSAWTALFRTFKSSVYYSDINAFLGNPPVPGEYDLVGLHFSPSVLKNILVDGDQIVGMLRDPTDRFLSGILHSRRQREDRETFTASQKAMRGMRISDFAQTSFGSYEIRLQLIALGTDYRQPFQSYTDQAMLSNALEYLQGNNVLFGPSHQSARLFELLSQRLNVRIPNLKRLNANVPNDYTGSLCEFQEAFPLIESVNFYERQLYNFVCDQFAHIAS